MMIPQLTAQYGQMEWVSVVRAIFNALAWANTGFASNSKSRPAAPPLTPNLMKSRRFKAMRPPDLAEDSCRQHLTPVRPPCHSFSRNGGNGKRQLRHVLWPDHVSTDVPY